MSQLSASVSSAVPPDPRLVRADRMAHEGAYTVLAAARAAESRPGPEVIHLEIGQPDLPPPAHVLRALVDSLGGGETGYTDPAGLPALREAIAAALVEEGCLATARRVLVTPGGKGALHLAIASLVAEGEAVLVPDPGFPSYASLVRNAAGIPVPYHVGPDEDATLDALERAVTPRTRAAVVNVPHNPTGQALSAAGRARLGALVRRHGLTLISDEVYGLLQYDGAFRSLAAEEGLAEQTLVVNSLSKSHAMPGFRLGWLAVPPARNDLADRAERIAVNTFGCVPPFVQRAGLAALDGPQSFTAALRETLADRAARGGEALRALDGVGCPVPAGGLYLFADIREILGDDLVTVAGVAESLLEHERVAVLPGTAFGPGGAGHLRLSLAARPERLAEGIRRVGRGLARLAAGGRGREVA